MVWQEPKELEGQEVVYVEGKNDGKMRVKPGGLLGSVGFLSLPPDDPRTRQTSKHKITEAGIGKLIEQCEKGWQVEQKLKVTTVKIGTFTYAKRRCTRVELTHPTARRAAIQALQERRLLRPADEPADPRRELRLAGRGRRASRRWSSRSATST